MTELRKSLTRSVVHPHMPRGYRDRLVITIHPGAIIEVGESRRRETVRLDVGVLYVKELIRRAGEQRRRETDSSIRRLGRRRPTPTAGAGRWR